MKENRVLVVGAGPAGLMAAGVAAARGMRVTLMEHSRRPARKLMITGKGRCNLTNFSALPELIASTPGNGRFLYSAFSAFSPEDLMALVEKQGVPLKVERGNRVFPVSDKAVDIVDALVGFATKSGAVVRCGDVKSIRLENGRAAGVILSTGEVLDGDAVVLATGGLSYPATGSTGDGYQMAAAVGHTIVETAPSLVPLETEEDWPATVQGLSLRNIALRVNDTVSGRVIYEDFGEMLFTHFGVSGTVILSASAHMRAMAAGRYRLALDLKPALTPEQLDRRVLRDFARYAAREMANALFDLLPRSMVPVVLQAADISPDRRVCEVTVGERRRLVSTLKNLPLTVKGFRPVAEAVVTRGGVSVKEVDPRTMRSKRIENLSFAGEMLDVDAYTGGFNLQIAFSTGFLAGSHVLEGGEIR